MNIRVFKAYQKFSDLPLLCGVYPDHGPLLCRLDKRDDIELYCIACDYIRTPGFALYRQIVAEVERIKPEWKDYV